MKFRTLFDPSVKKALEDVETIEGDWEEAILICTKCASKIRGEIYMGKTRLKGEIKESLKSEGLKSVRVLEVSCLDVCERGRVAVATTMKSPLGKRILLVPPATSGKSVLKSLLMPRS